MRTIFDGLVEEFRAWHLFEQQDRGSRPGLSMPGYGAGGYGAGGYDSRGPDYGPPEPATPEFGRIEYGRAGYFDRAPQYGWDLDEAVPQPDSPR